MEISMYNQIDMLIIHKFIDELAICFWAEQIVLMAEEKQPVRNFLRLFATKQLRNEDKDEI